MTNILSKLKLTNETKQAVAVDKTALRRDKVLKNLLEQGEIAKAMLNGTDYVSTRLVTKIDVEGNPREVEKRRRIKRWFYNNGKSEWFLEIRFANRAVELAKGKTAIVVPNKDKLVETIELVASAVSNGELDTAINKIADEKKRTLTSVK